MSKRVMVGMSGGVDSAVSAFLLKNEGYDVSGVNCRFFDNDDIFSKEKSCCSLDDVLDARAVADKIGIPFHVFNFKEDFNRCVIDKFTETYMSGATPNPCIDCNRFLKFDRLLRRAMELEFDYIATGHYARVEFDEGSGRYLLKKGKDKKKDQSYVLYCLSQFQLSHTLLPLGGYEKSEIREIAAENGFVNAKKHESQDICFVPDGDYASFIEKRTGKTFPCGDFVDENGKVLGSHKGMIRYTVGQRRGLGLALPAPMYVKEKNIDENKVILTSNDGLFSKALDANDINLIACERIDTPLRVKARVRYNQNEQPATVIQIGEDTVHVEFDEPQRAIAKGQAVVFYDDDIVVGGGTIL